MTKKMLKRIAAVMIAACLCLEVFAVQAAEPVVSEEMTGSLAAEEEVSVSEQAEPELPVLEALPEDLPELSGDETGEPETPELPAEEEQTETEPEEQPATEPAEEPELPVVEEQSESGTDPENLPVFPVVEIQPESETGSSEPDLPEQEIRAEEQPVTEPEAVEEEPEQETAAEETEEEAAETEPETETEEELAALNETDEKLTSFLVAPVEITEYTNGWWDGYEDENGQFIDHAYFYYNPGIVGGPGEEYELQYTIEYDGESYTGNREDIYNITGEYPVPGPNNQSYENQWTAGNTYTVEFTLLGKTAELSITIQPSPLESIEVEPVEIIEYTQGYWEGHYDDNDQFVKDFFVYDSFQYELQYKVVYNGEVIEGNQDDIFNSVGEYPSVSYGNQYEEHWNAGQTYQATAELMGKSCEFNVTILPSPLTSFEAEPIQIIEKTKGCWTEDPEGGDRYYYYLSYYIEEELRFNITYNGQPYSGTASSLSDEIGEWVSISGYSDQDQEHWTVGHTYHATASLMGKTCDVEIQIVPSPLTGFSVDPVSVTEGTMGYVTSGSGSSGLWYNYNVLQLPLQFTVQTPEGKFQGTAQDLYQHYGYGVSVEQDDQRQNHWSAGNTYTVKCGFMGMEADLAVTVLPSPVTAFTVHDIEIVENTNGYYMYISEEEPEVFQYRFDLNEITCEVALSGTYTGPLAGLEEEYGYAASITSDQYPPNQWTAGHTYTATAWFMGKTCDFQVTVVEDTTDWEIEDGTLYVHQGADMQNWAPKAVPWYADRTSITRAVIEDGVKKIGSNAFSGCTSLTEVVVPDSVAYIGANAFYGCTSLTAVSIPDQVSFIDQSAFFGCTQLTQISLPDTVTSIVYYAFRGCTSLESIDLPVSVKTIKSGAFSGCSSLTDVNYGGTESDRNKMVIWGDNAPLLSATWHYREVTGLTLNTHEIVTCVGYPKELYFMGEDEIGRLEGTWESSDAGVAYYDDENDRVMAAGPGEATISFTSSDGEYHDECAVTVYTGLDHEQLTFRLGTSDDPQQLLFLDPYGEAVDGAWSSADPEVAVVSESGLVTPVGEGTTTVSFEFAQGELTAECEISVIPPRYELNFQEFRIAAGRQRACFTFYGLLGNESDGVWESTDPEVAFAESVSGSEMALIKGVRPGTATITYTTKDGKHSDSCQVTVIRGLNYHEPLILQAGGNTVQLSYAGADGVEHTDGIWTSTHPDVATVAGGLVTPVGEGETTIEYYGQDPNVEYDYCTVTVIEGQVSYEWAEDCSTCLAKLIRTADQGVAETETVVPAVYVMRAVSCERNGENLYEAAFTKPVFETQTKTVEIPTPGHMLVKTEAVEATYEKEGNIAYWTCSVCSKHFSDETGTKEISLEDTVLPKLVRTGWQDIDGKRYYYKDGMMLKSWQKIDAKWYYLGADGVMRTDWQKISKKWYYFGTNGIMCTGWEKISKKWYYFNSSGAMLTGWQEIGGKQYYLNASGVMLTGWQEIGGKQYYLGTDGVMKTGWLKIDAKWYRFGTDGAMQTGWQKISKKWYHFDSDGVMQTGWQKISKKWYYFGTDGIMRTGWQKISAKWYYFNTSGVMLTGTHTIDGKSYTFNSSGVWTGN